MNYQELIKKFVCAPVLSKITKCKQDSVVVEFDIYSFNDAKPKESMEGLAKLYKECRLDKDPAWHFFIEGQFIVLRCSENNMQKVFDYLEDNDMTYHGPRTWREPWEITKRYQHSIFRDLFHNISEAVMVLYHDELTDGHHDYFVYAIAERMIHAWFNHNAYLNVVMGNGIDTYKDSQHWEAGITAKIALDRASFGGRYSYILKQEAERKAKANESKDENS